jgi:hypothetical protein
MCPVFQPEMQAACRGPGVVVHWSAGGSKHDLQFKGNVTLVQGSEEKGNCRMSAKAIREVLSRCLPPLRFFHRPCVLFVLLHFVVRVGASTVVVPAGYSTVDGHDGTLILSQVIRMQECYGAALFPPTPITIQEIRFRPSTVYGQAFTSTIPEIQITMGTTTRSPEALSSTFANNLGSNSVVVFHGAAPVSSTFSGPANGPKAFDIAFPLTTPFIYNPALGNLLVEFKVVSPSPITIGVDAKGVGGDLAGRAYSVNPNSSTAGAVDVGADILQFVYGEVDAAPTILIQPQGQSVMAGDTAEFHVTAHGTTPLHYQWRFNGSELSGENQSSLIISNAQFSHAGEYSVRVTNALGSVTSTGAVLEVSVRPDYDVERDFSLAGNPNGVWTYGAKSALAGPLTPLSFARNGSPGSWEYAAGVWPAIYHNGSSSVFVTDGGSGFYPPRAVWYAAGEDGSPRNFGAIRFTVPTGGAGIYRVATSVRTGLSGGGSQDADYHVVYGTTELFGQFIPANGSASYTNDLMLQDGETVDFLIGRGADGRQYGSILKIKAALTWLTNATPQPPVIVLQPQGLARVVGSKATFTVAATGSRPMTWQWNFNGSPMANETNATLELPAVQLDQAGAYSVVVANALGSVTSAEAVLLVTACAGYSLTGDFAIGSNPNGVWSYGTKSSLDGAMTLSSYSRSSGSDEAWEFTQGRWPAIYHNTSGQTILTHGGAGVYPDGAVWYAAGEDGTARNFGAIRFTVPHGAAGRYRLETSVLPGLTGSQGQDADFHVVINGTEIFGQFLPANVGTGYTNERVLLSDDTVDFMIGRGEDARQWGSILKIEATLNWVTNAGPLSPSILQQPRSLTVETGQVARFEVVARAEPPPAFQWQFNGASIPGATNAAFEIAHAQTADSGEYLVLVSNSLGSLSSIPVTLSVTSPPPPAPPSIVTQPAGRTVLEGEAASFIVVAAGSPPLSYQWLFNDSEIAGATGPSVSLSQVQMSQAGAYSVRVTNFAGSVVSDAAALVVQPNTNPPSITRQPVNRTVPPGGVATFSVTASGAQPLTFQWRHDETPLPGATNSALTISGVQPSSAGGYSVEVANNWGTAISDVAVLTVSNVVVAGTVVFANRGGGVDAPVFDVDGVTRITGQNLRAELLAGPTVGAMKLAGADVGFTYPLPGYFSGGTRGIPNVAAGQSAYVQVRVWDRDHGTNYEHSAANGGRTGASVIFSVLTSGASPLSFPAYLGGLSSFALTNAVAAAAPPLVISPGEVRADGTMEWILTGPANVQCVIERSRNFVDWSAVMLLHTTTGEVRFTDPSGGTGYFYRARLAE